MTVEHGTPAWLRLTRLAAIAGALAVAPIAATQAQAPDPENPVTVTLGTIPIAPLVPAFLGVELGFFAEEGIDLQMRPEPGGQDIVTAVIAGEFDFGFSNQTSLLIAASRGLGVRPFAKGVVGSPDVESAWDGLIVPDDSDIQSPQDLVGKVISVNTLHNTPHLVLLAALEKAGVENPESSISYVEVQFPDAVGAVRQGTVDAAWVVEPFVTVGALNDTRVLMRPLIETAPNFLMSAYFTSDRMLEQQPEVVAAFERAINRSMEYASANPDAVREAFPRFNPAASEMVAGRMALPVWDIGLSPEDFEMGAELALRYGLVQSIPDLDGLVHVP